MLVIIIYTNLILLSEILGKRYDYREICRPVFSNAFIHKILTKNHVYRTCMLNTQIDKYLYRGMHMHVYTQTYIPAYLLINTHMHSLISIILIH